jgi:hypothetical protein
LYFQYTDICDYSGSGVGRIGRRHDDGMLRSNDYPNGLWRNELRLVSGGGAEFDYNQ